MLGFPLLLSMRIMTFQLSGFYCRYFVCDGFKVLLVACSGGSGLGLVYEITMWEFTKIGDPNTVP